MEHPEIVPQERLLQVASSYDHPRVVVCRVTGEVDLYSAPLLHEELQRAVGSRHHVVVDLSGVTFFSLAGLAVPERASEAAGPGCEVVLAAESDAVGRVLDVPAMTLVRHPTVPAAVTACTSTPTRGRVE